MVRHSLKIFGTLCIKGLILKLPHGRYLIKSAIETFPVDTGRKLNAHKTFGRRLGRLLNVLCKFNLRPVSTGLYTIK